MDNINLPTVSSDELPMPTALAGETHPFIETPWLQPTELHTDTLPPQDKNIFFRATDKIREKWIGGNSKAYLFVNTIAEEYRDGITNSDSIRDRAGLRGTSALAITGQTYERARLPETFGVSVGTNVYRDITERGHITLLSTIVGSLALGAFVYGQQKIIGKNWIKTTVHYPKTYDAAKQFWPKIADKADETLPDLSHPVLQGIAMVSLGNTPFIANARTNNPSISTEELEIIERKVTNRGSVAAVAAGGLVLGALSAAPHMPSKIWKWNTEWLPEKMISSADTIVDTLSDPKKVLIGFIGLGLVQGLYGSLKSKFSKNKLEK